LVEKPKGKKLFARPRHGWEGNIKMDLQKIGLKGVDWIHVTEDTDRWRAVVSTA
jgi:hypothetical protein